MFAFFATFGLSFLALGFASNCNSCVPVTLKCGTEAGFINGIFSQNIGTDGSCQTLTLHCGDDANTGVLAIIVVENIPDTSFFSGDTLPCGTDGTWGGGGVNLTVNCYVLDSSVVSTPTCELTTTSSTTTSSTTTSTTPTSTSTEPTESTTTSGTNVTTTSSTCCSEWSSWSSATTCSDYCGGCAYANYTRMCLTSATCSCPGVSEKTEPCNMMPCVYPRKSCCGNAKVKIVSGQFVCLAPDQVIESPPQTCNCCPELGIWSSWTEVNCSNTCGAYGTGLKKRTCLSEPIGCPCTGAARETGTCGLTLCSYPTKSCADGFKAKVVNSAFVCASSTTTVQTTQCCPSEGLWNSWTGWSNCNTVCGGCSNATRTRTCASDAYGCPCKTASTKESLPCNTLACSSGTQCCVGNPVTLSSQLVCVASAPSVATTPAPVWGEWTDSACTDTCGMCGVMQQTRSCISGTCTGPSVQNSSTTCPDSLCAVGLGKPTCCSPSSIKVVNGQFVCRV